MGLDDRFGGKPDDKEKDNKSKDDKSTESKDSTSMKEPGKGDDKSTNGGGKAGAGDGKGKSTLGDLAKNPYAQNAKDVVTGKKSKEQAAVDAGKHALKKHGAKVLSKAAMPAIHYGALGVGYLYLADKALQIMNFLLNLIFNNPITNIIGNIMAMASSAWSAVSGAVSAAANAIVHGTGTVLNLIGSAAAAVAHSVTGSAGVATGASIAAQITAVVTPLAVVGSLATAILAPKNADNIACEIAQIASPSYGQLGAVSRDPNNSDKTAISVYNAFRKGGYTKNVALAITANLSKESTFNPESKNDIGAFGLAQWMGNRYNNLQAYASQHHAKITDFSTQLNFVNEELQHSYKNVLDQATKAGSLADATDAITNGYEVPGEAQDVPRQEQAATYEKLVSGSKSGAADSAASNNDALAQSAADSLCGKNDTEDAADWTGSIKENIPDIGAHYSTDDVPSDIKAFVKSPTLVGMKDSDGGAGWDVPSGNDPMQCVSFAVPYFLKIHKNMSMKDWLTGNGQDIAGNAAKKFGGKVSKVPHAGALASAIAGKTDNNLETGSYGHVFVVSHVLKNGTVIGLEENMTWAGKNLSGTWTHTVNWDYVVLTKATYEKWDIQFYTPDNKKYPLNFNGKS